MRSVADDLRDETIRDFAQLPVQDRVRIAYELGDRDLRAYAAEHQLTRNEALSLLQRHRILGRRRSRCIERLLT